MPKFIFFLLHVPSARRPQSLRVAPRNLYLYIYVLLYAYIDWEIQIRTRSTRAEGWRIIRWRCDFPRTDVLFMDGTFRRQIVSGRDRRRRRRIYTPKPFVFRLINFIVYTHRERRTKGTSTPSVFHPFPTPTVCLTSETTEDIEPCLRVGGLYRMYVYNIQPHRTNNYIIRDFCIVALLPRSEIRPIKALFSIIIKT